MTDTVIRVENLSKRFRIGAAQENYDTLRDAVTSLFRRPSTLARRPTDTDLWALKDVSFEVQQGEVVGIIGRNGAGKSTLLKILSRITEPTSGRVELHGRVASLLEVGTGFHPELTGRENIYLNGAILGMKRREIDRKFDEIVAFAEIERFLDTPVKRYSSGMYVRLAFAVAAHLEPEILLVDEVLAVGDAAFQRKALGKMGDVVHNGRTVIFVSHNMAAIQALCPRVMLLTGGTIESDAGAVQSIQRYTAKSESLAQTIPLRFRKDRYGNGVIRIVGVRILGRDGGPTVSSGEDIDIQLDYECADLKVYRNLELAIGIRRADQTRMLYLGTKVTHQDVDSVQGAATAICHVHRLPLEPGRYSLTVEVKQNGIIVDCIDDAIFFDVADGNYYGTGVIWPYGGFLCDYSWSHGRLNARTSERETIILDEACLDSSR